MSRAAPTFLSVHCSRNLGDPTCTAAVLYFNNVGILGMCGHGTIGIIATLAYLGRIQPGHHKIETPVGIVSAELRIDGSVQIENVPATIAPQSSLLLSKCPGTAASQGTSPGAAIGSSSDWQTTAFPVIPSEIPKLTNFTVAIRKALTRQNITGEHGEEIDHVELFADSPTLGIQSRNFVLCPGGAYDRSPCGTGTSAKLACLYADGKLAPGRYVATGKHHQQRS